MNFVRKMRAVLLSSAVTVLCGACGIVSYPGQPGVVTDGYSKIDLEFLDGNGLWVYETVYDNTPTGSGVGAVITKLYPKASTYTSNVRTNADGTLYRTKGNYAGAEVQMISIPKLKQMHISPTSKVQLFLTYETSLDEIDNKNIAEMNLFKAAPTVSTFALATKALGVKQLRWDVLRAGRLSRSGSLSYDVTSIELGKVTFKPTKAISLSTNFSQSAVQTDITDDVRKEAIQFIESNYPKGYTGTAKFFLRGTAKPMTMAIGIHTIKTVEAAGTKVIFDATAMLASQVKEQFAQEVAAKK